MMKIGLTGGIGCGKSTVTNAFKEKGIVIIDADKIAREVVKPNSLALNEIAQVFGDGVIQIDGSLNRAMLKEHVFSDSEKLKQLEAILHPKIKRAIQQAMRDSEAFVATSPYVIVDIPLLIEKNYNALFDEIVVVDCLPEQQIERVLQRDTMSLDIVKSIIAKQIKREERLKHADVVLDNSSTKVNLLQQVDWLHQRLMNL